MAGKAQNSGDDQAAQEAQAAADAAIALAKAQEPDVKHDLASVKALAAAGQAIPSGWAFNGKTGEFFEVASVDKGAATRQRVTAKA